MTKEGNGEQTKIVNMSLHMKCLLAIVFCPSQTVTTAVALTPVGKDITSNRRTLSFRERLQEQNTFVLHRMTIYYHFEG